MEEKEVNQLIRVSDPEALRMIRVLADDDLRNMGTEVAWLIRQEYARRYSQIATAAEQPQTVTQ